jgi:hypothetical protein
MTPDPQSVQQISNSLDWNSIILALIGVIGTVLSTIFAILLSKIHIAVNSERAATLEVIKNLRDDILSISKRNATLEERESPNPKKKQALTIHKK